MDNNEHNLIQIWQYWFDNTVIVLLKKYQVLFNLLKVWNYLIQIKILIVFYFISEGVLMSIECKAWAKNIKHNSMDRQGSVHFELMID